jgi:hypothetical protein
LFGSATLVPIKFACRSPQQCEQRLESSLSCKGCLQRTETLPSSGPTPAYGLRLPLSAHVKRYAAKVRKPRYTSKRASRASPQTTKRFTRVSWQGEPVLNSSLMNPLFRIKLALLAIMFCCCASASADESAQPATGASPSVVVKVEKAIERGAKAAASGVKKGVTAGAHGVERGAHAAASGVDRGVKAAGRGIEHGATATAHAAKTVARKVGTSPASSSAASN